jgi:hypothetical protein
VARLLDMIRQCRELNQTASMWVVSPWAVVVTMLDTILPPGARVGVSSLDAVCNEFSLVVSLSSILRVRCHVVWFVVSRTRGGCADRLPVSS